MTTLTFIYKSSYGRISPICRFRPSNISTLAEKMISAILASYPRIFIWIIIRISIFLTCIASSYLLYI